MGISRAKQPKKKKKTTIALTNERDGIAPKKQDNTIMCCLTQINAT